MIPRGALAALACLVAAPTLAVEVPYLTGRVNDDAEILRAETRRQLGTLLEQHEARTGNQVVVLTATGLQGESIEAYAVAVFKAWKLGQKGKDNGVLLVVAPRDRRMRIEVGYGLEGTLTDLAAGRIIRNVMTPRFKEGDFDGGVEAGVRAVLAQLEAGEAPPGDAEPATSGPVKTGKAPAFHFDGPDLPLTERILFGAFIFGIIGLFTVIGVLTPGTGWFLYLFLIPFWAMFPLIVIGSQNTLYLLATYLGGFPIAKLLVSRSAWYAKARTELKTKGRAQIGGFVVSSGGSSWNSGSGGSSGGGGFSGGGGGSGGGGASGSW